MSKYELNQKVKVADLDTGGGHYGKVEDIVKDMFNGADLYLVKVEGQVKTYTEESIRPLKKRK